jgi:hypothetical protein
MIELTLLPISLHRWSHSAVQLRRGSSSAGSSSSSSGALIIPLAASVVRGSRLNPSGRAGIRTVVLLLASAAAVRGGGSRLCGAQLLRVVITRSPLRGGAPLYPSHPINLRHKTPVPTPSKSLPPGSRRHGNAGRSGSQRFGRSPAVLLHGPDDW